MKRLISAILVILIVLLGACASPAQTTKTHIYIDGKIVVRGSGEPVELINNPDATNPTFAELITFLEGDHTYEYPYILGPPKNAFICSDFAETVHNNAEAAGIRAAWVGIEFEGQTEGHAINAFETTDLGLVYIDFTGKGLWDESHDLSSLERRAYVKIGEPYSIGSMNGGLSEFWFYISSQPNGGTVRINPSIWQLFSSDSVTERELQSQKRLEWHRTHDIIALGQTWIQEWLQKYEVELSQGGRVSEPSEGSGGTSSFSTSESYRTDQEWYVPLLDSNEVPWFQPEQVLAKYWLDWMKPDLYWEGFMDMEIIPADAKVEEKIIEVDGLPIAWEIGWKDLVPNQFKPFGDSVVTDIHIFWEE